MRNFQILIVSAVKICKQCLQTALVSGGLPTRALPMDPLGDFLPHVPWAVAPKCKFLALPVFIGWTAQIVLSYTAVAWPGTGWQVGVVFYETPCIYTC